jgi:hypothetical protein
MNTEKSLELKSKNMWEFTFNSDQKLVEQELKKYQEKLKNIRSKYVDDDVWKAFFRTTEEWLNKSGSRNDNVFARFGNEYCAMHGTVHYWHLLWNPNLSDETSWSSLSDDCFDSRFKVESKLIQAEIAETFPRHFKLIDTAVDSSSIQSSNNSHAFNRSFYEETRDYLDEIYFDVKTCAETSTQCSLEHCEYCGHFPC